MTQEPRPESFLLKWRGDRLTVSLRLDEPRAGRAVLRTNFGHARVRRREIIAETERGETPLARAWTDIPMAEVEPGLFRVEVPLSEVGVFSGKACFFPAGEQLPEWPEGRNFHVKVESSETRANNTIYCVFPRQFGSFRAVKRCLPDIMGTMGFRIIQTLPPFPVPTTYAVMGEYGCPFAALDFLSVDSAMAEFDEFATPLDQFRELIDAVHARKGLFFIDLPANHTGWASTLQTHHPDWFNHEADGRFHSPGAWGVKWADLVELDYSRPELRAYMADVFLFWCRNGVDGFRCDAGYMIPLKTWAYIVARVREEYPDTVFLLEGLGGRLEVTDALLAEANLDWAYSEIFQTYDRRQFEWYLPQAIARSEKYGTLVHFAETHDNDRLAKGGEVYARLRVQLAALLSAQGAWGIANGVEWYATEKIDVHGKNALNWGSPHNMVGLIARLNEILSTYPEFHDACSMSLVTQGEGNTLAVARGRLLVLANLNVSAPTTISWRRDAFGADTGYDLVTRRAVDVRGDVTLAPGEVLCLSPEASDPVHPVERLSEFVRRPSLFHWEYPRDERRAIVVPEEQWVTIAAAHPFRVRLNDPVTGRTLRVYRSRKVSEERFAARFDAPHYKGDGSRCRLLDLFVIVYADGESRRCHAPFLIPPRGNQAKVRLVYSGEEVRQAPHDRTILSNGTGASAQVRIGWGEIASQYDALLAANPNPFVPSDRLNLWSRVRGWLQREGYTREFDVRCITRFAADPAGRCARWSFHMPCGMGLLTTFEFLLFMDEAANRTRLVVSRTEDGSAPVGRVRIVLRPDFEWRSFHATTKAYLGPERDFVAGTSGDASHFAFSPYPSQGRFTLSVAGGVCHHEPKWTYNVSHPEEAARGQEPAGDLYSPGWISADLAIGESVELIGAYSSDSCPLPAPCDERPSVQPSELPFGVALRRALDLFIVRRDDLKTVIAGYPWFLDWGRDTFIFMRGMIAAGMTDDSVKILKAFAAFEDCGTLPNIIHGSTAGNRDTTDAPLWFVRCVQEVDACALGRVDDLKAICARIVDNYLAGTPNGIRVDSDSALVWSPSHFTWMDTNYPACTPRVGYPVEIQALWISALKFLGRRELACRARASLDRYFKWEHGYRDCLSAPHGEPAAQAEPEDTIRPNQLFLITLGVLEDRSILAATEELLVPGGIRSLNAGHPLYRGVYAGDEDLSRKPAYHNGTVWAWPFPLYAEALVRTGMCSPEVARQLLASAVENLNSGCIGHVSENTDGDVPHAQKGCTAQAWSDSELLRVWLWLGGEFHTEGRSTRCG